MTHDQLVRAAYRRYGRWGIGGDVNQIDRDGYDYWLAALDGGDVDPERFHGIFDAAVVNSWIANPASMTTLYTRAYAPGGGGFAEYVAELRRHGYMA